MQGTAFPGLIIGGQGAALAVGRHESLQHGILLLGGCRTQLRFNYDLAFLHYFYETLCGYAGKLSGAETCAEKRNALEQEEKRWRHVRGKLTELVLEAPCRMHVKLKGWSQEGVRWESERYKVDLCQGENVWL